MAPKEMSSSSVGLVSFRMRGPMPESIFYILPLAPRQDAEGRRLQNPTTQCAFQLLSAQEGDVRLYWRRFEGLPREVANLGGVPA